jgi:hypothetical protein
MRLHHRHRLFCSSLAAIGLLALAGCTNNQSGEQAPPPAAAPQATVNPSTSSEPEAAGSPVEMPADARGRSPYTYCLDLIRERRFADALDICRKAESVDPSNLEIRHAVQIAQQNSSGESESPTP